MWQDSWQKSSVHQKLSHQMIYKRTVWKSHNSSTLLDWSNQVWSSESLDHPDPFDVPSLRFNEPFSIKQSSKDEFQTSIWLRSIGGFYQHDISSIWPTPLTSLCSTKFAARNGIITKSQMLLPNKLAKPIEQLEFRFSLFLLIWFLGPDHLAVLFLLLQFQDFKNKISTSDSHWKRSRRTRRQVQRQALLTELPLALI